MHPAVVRAVKGVVIAQCDVDRGERLTHGIGMRHQENATDVEHHRIDRHWIKHE
ncbi:unannotated protein [freshwater metagenome]|uniref:Unannotated protein n=1 Tax=freshwater metagenome TaxID=449393 RepID=A0A6J7NIH0_9ZZZZ